MYEVVRILHSLNRWVVLVLLAMVVILAAIPWSFLDYGRPLLPFL